MEQEHRESKERAEMEHTEHITGLETITASVTEHIALIAECESVRGSLQESHAQVQAKTRDEQRLTSVEGYMAECVTEH